MTAVIGYVLAGVFACLWARAVGRVGKVVREYKSVTGEVPRVIIDDEPTRRHDYGAMPELVAELHSAR